MLAIAEQLITRGYEVCFVSGSGYSQQAESAGAMFVPVEGYGDFYDLTSWDLDADCMHIPSFYVNVHRTDIQQGPKANNILKDQNASVMI
jgi:UDP:flavonoid glycosyltransferase YjiC (YdhE family)